MAARGSHDNGAVAPGSADASLIHLQRHRFVLLIQETSDEELWGVLAAAKLCGYVDDTFFEKVVDVMHSSARMPERRFEARRRRIELLLNDGNIRSSSTDNEAKDNLPQKALDEVSDTGSRGRFLTRPSGSNFGLALSSDGGSLLKEGNDRSSGTANEAKQEALDEVSDTGSKGRFLTRPYGSDIGHSNALSSVRGSLLKEGNDRSSRTGNEAKYYIPQEALDEASNVGPRARFLTRPSGTETCHSNALESEEGRSIKEAKVRGSGTDNEVKYNLSQKALDEASYAGSRGRSLTRPTESNSGNQGGMWIPGRYRERREFNGLNRPYKFKMRRAQLCWRCTGTYHGPDECQAILKICHLCNEEGHIMRACAGVPPEQRTNRM